ncbi:hypothetical protein JCM5353_006531 [Sporobolomyces roseus]
MTRKETKLKKKLKEQERAASSPGAASEAHERRPYEVKEIAGKGMGVIATGDIKAGELVLKETPLITLQQQRTPAALERLMTTLTQSQKDDYNKLHIASNKNNVPKVLAIFQTNAMQLGPQSTTSGVFIEGSRFNHSCRPNCSRSWDERQGVEWFIANRDIGQGEELCITYGDTRWDRVERQRWLMETFGFECACEACSLSPDEVKSSDINLRYIKETDKSSEMMRPVPLRLIPKINRSLRLMEKEGIVQGGADLAYEALSVCIWYGDRLNASRWIDKTLELERKEAGIWSTKYRDVEAWKGDPTRHLGWEDLCRRLGIPAKVLMGPE